MLVSGYSGIGKSSVVNELHKPLVPPRGLFASGKFDRYKRDIPYATLAQAFQSLTRLLLSKSEKELSKWRDALREALDSPGPAACSSAEAASLRRRAPQARLTRHARKGPVMAVRVRSLLLTVTGILFATSFGSPLTATLIVRMPLTYPAVTSSASAPGGSSRVRPNDPYRNSDRRLPST